LEERISRRSLRLHIDFITSRLFIYTYYFENTNRPNLRKWQKINHLPTFAW